MNMTWMTRESLKKLKQTSSVREYEKEFSSLILDIKDMSEVDNLLNFMFGFHGWAQTELRRLGVQALPSAMSAANYLVDYKLSFPYSHPKRERPEARVESEVGHKDLQEE